MANWFEIVILLTGAVFIIIGFSYIATVTAQWLQLCRQMARFRRLYQEEDFPAALTAISVALNIDPCSASLYQSRARIYYELGDYFSAEADYTQSLRYSQCSAAYAGRSTARLALGQSGNALVDANHAIACSRLWWRAYYERGRVYSTMGHFGVALEDFDQALELTRTPSAEIFVDRANVLQRLDRAEEAICDYEKALKLNPGLGPRVRLTNPAFSPTLE